MEIDIYSCELSKYVLFNKFSCGLNAVEPEIILRVTGPQGKKLVLLFCVLPYFTSSRIWRLSSHDAEGPVAVLKNQNAVPNTVQFI